MIEDQERIINMQLRAEQKLRDAIEVCDKSRESLRIALEAESGRSDKYIQMVDNEKKKVRHKNMQLVISFIIAIGLAVL